MRVLYLAPFALLAACGGPGPHSKEGGAVAPLTVHAVSWNAAKAPVGKVRAVADFGDTVAVFADDGANVFTSGAIVASDHAVTDWVDADTIIGADGAAQWIVGVSSRGRVYHLRGRNAFEDVTDRYSLGGHRVRGAAVLGPGYVGFLLDNEIALADGQHVTRYGVPVLGDLVGGGGFGAGITKDAVVVFSAAARGVKTYALPHATAVALGHDGRVYATTPRAVYASDAAGQLALLYETSHDAIHGLVASGDHVWFADGSELGAVEGTRVLETSGANIAADAKLESSPTGDVWVLSGGGLARFSREGATPTIADPWTDKLSPIFARSCAACHLPGGPSGVDSSTAAAWQAHRAVIHDRVVVTKTMPPQGHTIADPDREVIRSWTEP